MSFPSVSNITLQVDVVQQPIQQRRRKAADIGDTQRTPDPGMKDAEDVSERWRTLSGVSRMRYSHPLPRLEPPLTWIGALAFLDEYRFVQQRQKTTAEFYLKEIVFK